MAIVINRDNTKEQAAGTPGKGAMKPALWNASRQVKVVTGSFDLDNSYPTGGYDISSLWAARSAGGVFANGPWTILVGNRLGYVLEVDYTTKKLKVYWFNYPGGAAAAAAEVTNATDLSTLTGVRFLAFGA